MISVKAELARRNLKYAHVADKTHIPRSFFYKKLATNEFTLPEAERIFSAIGTTLILVKT